MPTTALTRCPCGAPLAAGHVYCSATCETEAVIVALDTFPVIDPATGDLYDAADCPSCGSGPFAETETDDLATVIALHIARDHGHR